MVVRAIHDGRLSVCVAKKRSGGGDGAWKEERNEVSLRFEIVVAIFLPALGGWGGVESPMIRF